MINRLFWIVLFLMALGSDLVAQQSLPLTMERIFLQPYTWGIRPQNPTLAPNGESIVYRWNSNGMDTLYLYWQPTLDTKPVKVSPVPSSRFLDWFENESFFFLENRVVKLFHTRSGRTEIIFESDRPIRSVDFVNYPQQLVIFREDDILVLNREKKFWGKTIKVKEDKTDNLTIIGRIGQSNRFVLVATMADSVKNNRVPHWMNDEVYTTESLRFATYFRKHLIVDVDSSKIRTIKIGKNEWMEGYGGPSAISPDGKWLAYSNIAIRQHDRIIILYNLETHHSDTVFHESDTAWVNPFPGFGFSSDSRYLAFNSELSSWGHIYTLEVGTKKLTPQTWGPFEIDWFQWDPVNSNTLWFTSTEKSPNHRHIWKLDISTGNRQQMTTTDGFRNGISISSNNGRMVYQFSDLNHPGELVLLNPRTKKEQVLTSSVPDSFHQVSLTPPSLIEIDNPNQNWPIPAQLFLPDGFSTEKGQRYPGVIFLHGAGHKQNVFHAFGYQSYWREYLFHQYLAQNGFVVINIDFSGSEGYGRENRVSIYKDMGGPDWQDMLTSAAFMIDSLQVDSGKIGIYGGSYGGFLTLMGMFKSPDLFKAGAALRSVANWKLYNRWYTEQRLGPYDENKDVYEKTSPVTFADSLKNHLLLLHGMEDSNVLFQDIVQLNEKLIKAKKKFDVMYYPTENHSFRDHVAWYHEYMEILHHFERYLKK